MFVRDRITQLDSRLGASNKVIIGGGLVGAELAEFMAERGREVSVFEEGPVLAKDMSHPRRWRVLHDLRDAGVVLHAETEVTAIGADTLEFRSLGSETNVQSLPVDTVIIATGLVANPEGVEALRSAGLPLVVIGDANGTAYLDGAIEQGFMAAIDLG